MSTLKFPTAAEAREFLEDTTAESKSSKSPSLKRKLSTSLTDCDGSVSVPSSKLRQWCDELKSVTSSLEALQNVLKGDIVDFDAICGRIVSVASDLEQTSGLGTDDHKVKRKCESAAGGDKQAAKYSVSPDGLTTDEDGFVVVFTDGACEGNGKASAKAGIGVYWSADHPWNVSEPVKGDKATNNVAEIQVLFVRNLGDQYKVPPP